MTSENKSWLKELLFGENIEWQDDPRHDTNILRKTEVKYDLIRPYVEDKSCLDIGCAGGGSGFVTDDHWLHGWLSGQTSKAVGIDIDEQGIEVAEDAGYDVYVESAEEFDLSDTFEVIVAANVIEHLASPGEMLESAYNHLEEGGQIIITTPRTHLPWNLLRQLKNEEGIQPHPEHTMWFCRQTLESILERKGFKIVEYRSWGFDRIGMSPADRAWRTVERQLSKVPQLHEIDDYQHFIVATPDE